MLSRIADSLYWMGRYLERVDNTARLIEINLQHLLEAEDVLSESAQWRPLLAISASEQAYEKCASGTPITADTVIRFMTRERTNGNAMWVSLRLSRENARVVRDRISREMWEALNELWLQVDQQLRQAPPPHQMPGFCAAVRNAVARFHGLAVTTMVRGEAFGFYSLGTFVERGDMTARILDVKYHTLLPDVSLVGSPLDYYHWAALLRSLSGFEAYRRKYHAGLRPMDVAEFLILDPAFPRSLRFAADRVDHALHIVGAETARAAQAVAQRLHEQVTQETAERVIRVGLHEFLQDFLGNIDALDGALATDYFDRHRGA